MSEELQSTAHFWHIVRKYCLIAVLITITILTILAWLRIPLYWEVLDYIENGKEYTAVYVDITAIVIIGDYGSGYSRIPGYKMQYCYINDEGKECYGDGPEYTLLETAKTHLGEKVQVLENKKGNSMIKPTEEIDGLKERIINASIYTIVTGVFVILVIIFRKRIFHFTPKKPKEKKVAKSE